MTNDTTAHEWPDTLKLALWALNAAPRFRVDDTDSYAIAGRIEEMLRKNGHNPYAR